ncbi:MAG: FAD-binding protein, partial [Clostridia bacterium]|nr:FAD-binding protein [Clostridia bacterium]
VIAFGMISSDLGLIVVPHLDAPAGLEELSEGIFCYREYHFFGPSVDFYIIRGIKNPLQQSRATHNIRICDFMRGEETQIMGILKHYKPKTAINIITLGTHFKAIHVDASGKICKSMTTMSGQLFDCIINNTIVGKSVATDELSELSLSRRALAELAKEMLEKYAPRALKVVNNQYAEQSNTGDGIIMAMWAGAAIDRNHAGGCAFDRAAINLDHHVGAPYDSALSDIWWPGSQPWLNVNTKGERFTCEDLPYDFHINSWLHQPGSFCYQIFDSNYWSDVNAFHTTICSRVVAVPGARNSEVLPGVYPCTSGEDFYNVYMAPALESGKLKQADTIEELAAQLGMDDEAVAKCVASVERYNELCDKGVDDDFGKQSKDLTPIKQGPFYGIAIGSWLLATMNGVRVNLNLQAVDENANPIEGLYMIGNDMGGFFSNSYPQMYGGTMQGKTTCFARLAALHAVTGSIYED